MIMPAQQLHRTGSFTLPCSAAQAFPLFSPEGERLWIKNWNPQPIFPNTIEFRRDTVFREDTEFHDSLWTILDADPIAHRAEYVRHAPNSHAAHIIVKLDPVTPDAIETACRVTVTYIFTPFGPNADELAASFSESAYTKKMLAWQRQLTTYLSSLSS
jgi:hypothetical protein